MGSKRTRSSQIFTLLFLRVLLAVFHNGGDPWRGGEVGGTANNSTVIVKPLEEENNGDESPVSVRGKNV